MLLSRLRRKRPRIVVARTRRPPSPSISMIVFTHSYKMAFPAFFCDSVFVATWAREHVKDVKDVKDVVRRRHE